MYHKVSKARVDESLTCFCHIITLHSRRPSSSLYAITQHLRRNTAHRYAFSSSAVTTPAGKGAEESRGDTTVCRNPQPHTSVSLPLVLATGVAMHQSSAYFVQRPLFPAVPDVAAL